MNTLKLNWLTGLFILLYVLVTVATLRHSAAGFASLEGGNLVWGYMSALAVDAGMALSATGLRKRKSGWLIIGLFVSGAASTYTQLLYAIANAAMMTVAPGAQWLGVGAQQIANARVLILPALLPVLSIVYSFSSKSVGAEQNSITVQQVAELERERDTLKAELEHVNKLAPLVELLPQQSRAELYMLADGNGTKPRQVAERLRISLGAAQRGVKAARKQNS